MASIRNRSPWRVSIKGAPERDATFHSKKQATAHARVLEAQGMTGLRIAKDRTGVWEVRIRRTGFPTLTKCFETKRAADDWAAAREGEISKREFIDYRAADKVTAGDLFKRFSEEKTTPGPVGGPERNRLKVFQVLPLATKKMSALRPSDIAEFRDAETKRGLKGPSVLKGLELMCRVFNTASCDWKIYLPMNPAMPSLRDRQISPHTIRHTTAMHLLQSGESIDGIALWLGHESPTTTH